MAAQQQRDSVDDVMNDLVSGLFAHIALLRKELQWIGETTQDPSTKMQVAHALHKSLTMPPSPE